MRHYLGHTVRWNSGQGLSSVRCSVNRDHFHWVETKKVEVTLK